MDTKENAGFIIFTVIAILIAMILMGTVFLNLTSIDFTAAKNYSDGLQAEMTAKAGLEYAIYVLMIDKYGTDSIVYNNNSYPYYGTSTLGYDESYDAYTEEWLGTGANKIFGSASASSNAVDNNGDGLKDSQWINVPFSLDRGLRAQYAILIEDVGESRINVNATGNVVGTTGVFVYGTGATTYDIRLQDILTGTVTKNVIGTITGRCGTNGIPGTSGTSAAQFRPRNPSGDDRPFNVLDAADICFGTYSPSVVYQSRLRNIINNETLFQNARGSLTVYSFDSIIANDGISSLLLPDNKNYYRLKLDNTITLSGTTTISVGSVTAQLQEAGFIADMAAQIAVHIKDYLDADSDITAYPTPYGTQTKFGLEPHPFINELYYTGNSADQQHQYLIELYNPFNFSIGSSTLSINGSKMDLVLKVTKTPYSLSVGSPSCIWIAGTITTKLCPIDTANFGIQPKGYVVLGYGTQNTAISLSGTQTVTGFDIYDYDSNAIPQEVAVTLLGSSSALNTGPNGPFLILDKAVPDASYQNTVRGIDLLWIVYQYIAFIDSLKSTMSNNAYNALIGQTGFGAWGPPHSSTKTGNNALANLVEPDTGTNVVWNPGLNGVNNAIANLYDVITKTQTFLANGQITSVAAAQAIIADTQEALKSLNGYNCNDNLNKRSSIGERKNPLIERGAPNTNWGTATTSAHTLGQVNYSYSLVPLNERKQLVVANKNMTSLGEMGYLLTIGYDNQSSYTNNTLYNVTGSNTVDNAKLSLINGTGTNIPEYFTILDPKNDAIDDDNDNAVGTDTGNQTGDIDGTELQVPGRININTAPTAVIAALPGTNTSTSMGTWSTLQGNLINNIITNRPYNKNGDIRNVPGIDYFGTDNVDNDGDGIIDDKEEKDLIYTTIANLITTHSNVFAVYVTARIVNSNATQTFAEKKLVAIVDRSVSPIKIRYFRWITEW